VLSVRLSSHRVPTALILDDDPERHRLFRRGLVGTGVHVKAVDTATDAIDWLRENIPDFMFLDHDLSDHGNTIEVAGTGMDVAQYVIKHHNRFHHTTIVVHSLNPVYGPDMVRCLRLALLHVTGYPFIWKEPVTLEAAVTGSLFPNPRKRVS
jgi:CheY-like chemotaxis protein